MESIKRLYFTLAAGFAILIRNKVEIKATEDGMISNRVSREVDHYRTHFFNL
jgi:hypothetical protein